MFWVFFPLMTLSPKTLFWVDQDGLCAVLESAHISFATFFAPYWQLLVLLSCQKEEKNANQVLLTHMDIVAFGGEQGQKVGEYNHRVKGEKPDLPFLGISAQERICVLQS